MGQNAPRRGFMQPNKAQALTMEQSKLLMNLIVQADGLDANPMPKGLADCFPAQIITKRLQALELPIKITNSAILGLVLVMADSPGAIVVSLIDCLEFAYPVVSESTEVKTISLKEVCEIYPFGFYTKDCLAQRIEGIKNNPNESWNFIY
jgi:hypothetical protein